MPVPLRWCVRAAVCARRCLVEWRELAAGDASGLRRARAVSRVAAAKLLARWRDAWKVARRERVLRRSEARRVGAKATAFGAWRIWAGAQRMARQWLARAAREEA